MHLKFKDLAVRSLFVPEAPKEGLRLPSAISAPLAARLSSGTTNETEVAQAANRSGAEIAEGKRSPSLGGGPGFRQSCGGTGSEGPVGGTVSSRTSGGSWEPNSNSKTSAARAPPVRHSSGAPLWKK